MALNKLRSDAEIALGTCRQELSNLQLAHKHVQVNATLRLWLLTGSACEDAYRYMTSNE